MKILLAVKNDFWDVSPLTQTSVQVSNIHWMLAETKHVLASELFTTRFKSSIAELIKKTMTLISLEFLDCASLYKSSSKLAQDLLLDRKMRDYKNDWYT